MSERWRPVVGHEDRYEVSDFGQVRTVDHWSRNGAGPFMRKGRVLKPSLSKRGYLMIDMRKRGGRNRTVHSLVLEAFVGPRPDGMEILHGNGDGTDNRLVNLRYGTRSENGFDSVRHGTNKWAAKTRCPDGHRYTPENTYIGRRDDGRTFRMCKVCTLRRRHGKAVSA